MTTILRRIAAQLYDRAGSNYIARHVLKRGLALTLRRDNGDWVLSLTRDGVQAGELEEQICRRAFDIPADAERHTDRINGWWIVRLRWPAARAEQLSFVGEETKSVYYERG